MGHIGSERAGMKHLADILVQRHPELSIQYIECGEVPTAFDFLSKNNIKKQALIGTKTSSKPVCLFVDHYVSFSLRKAVRGASAFLFRGIFCQIPPFLPLIHNSPSGFGTLR